MLTHPAKAHGRIGHLLMIEKGLLAPIQSSQRRDLRGINAKFLATMAPQSHGHHSKCVEQSTTHAQEPDMHGQAKFMGVPPTCIDQLALGTIKGENAFISKSLISRGSSRTSKNVVCQPFIVLPQ